MRHAAGSTRTAPRRRSTRALLVGLLSASLLTTGSSSLATGDVDVEPTVAATESVVAEPTGEPSALATSTPATDDGEDTAMAEPAAQVPATVQQDSAGRQGTAQSSAVAPMATDSWDYRIVSTSPGNESRVLPSSTVTYDVRAGVGSWTTSREIELSLTLTDGSAGGALLEHVMLEGVSRGQGSISVSGSKATWDVGTLSGGWLWGDSSTASFRATIGPDAPEGTLTATITGNARGSLSGTGSVSHIVDHRLSNITVKTAGLRTGLGASAVSAEYTEGSRFALYSGEGATTPVNGDWARCTTAANGDCTFTGVPPGQYWVGQIDSVPGSLAAANYNPITKLSTGTTLSSGAPNFTDRTYRFQTPSVYDSTYTIPANDPRTSDWLARSNTWVNQLNNPTLQQSCQAGLDIAILMDLSGSVVPFRDDMRDAAKGFVGALSGTGSAVALYSFGDASPRAGSANYPAPLNVDVGNNITTLNSRIDDYRNRTITNQGTNWDAGLWAVGSAQHDYDLVVVLTDGNPTYSSTGQGTGSLTTFRELERAVLSANAIKDSGARIVTVGIGGGLSDHNLSAISGPSKHQPGADINEIDYLTSSWQELQPVLEDFAAGLSCNASVVVDKVERDVAGNESPGAGWTFTAERSGDGELTSSPSQTTGAQGRVRFDVGFEHPEHTAALTITETQRAGWALEEVTCSVNGGASVPVAVTGRSFAPADLGIGDRVVCTVVNVELPSYDDLDVTVTAWPTFARDYDWTIEKTARDEEKLVRPGHEATFTYDLTVDPGDPIDSGFVVAGEIRVANPNDIDFTGVSVTGVFPHPSCTFDDAADLTVAAEETVSLEYSCDLPSATPTTTGQVSATASWNKTAYRGTSGSADGDTSFDFAVATPTTTNSTVRVVDTEIDLEDYDGGGAQVGNVVNASSGRTTFTYELSWTGEAGTCTPYENTAWLYGTQASRTISESAVIAGPVDATVTVCSGADLTVDRTVAPEHDRTYAWAIDKSADHSSIDVDADTGTTTVSYAVDVTPGAATDSGWAMDGTIALTNPNDWQAVTATVSLAATLGGNASCTFPNTTDVDPTAGGLQVTVPAKTDGSNGSLEVDYSCTLATQPALTGTVTAHAVWDAAEHVTAHDRTTAMGELDETDWDITETNRTVTVRDDKTNPAAPVTLGTVTWDDGPKTFTYSLTHEGERGGCVDHTNRAWILQTGQESEWDVEVCWPVPGIEVVKSAWNGDVELPQGVTLPVGTLVTWEYEVTNTGTSELTDIELEDTYTTTGGASGKVEVDCPSTSLAPGVSMTCTGSGSVGAGVYGWAAPQP